MGLLAYFNGKYVPLADVKIGIQTHALHYGTACFEGIRGYWNAEAEQMYIFRLREHYERLANSARTIRMKLPASIDELCDLTVELIARQGIKEDVYIRPLLYKSNEVIGVRVHGLDDGFVVYAQPFGKYLNTDAGIRCCVSSWRRIEDSAIPARCKITGSYINSALAKSEAIEDGYDEAIMLNEDGHVAEGSGENIFLVIKGEFVTPGLSENILPGITRNALMRVALEEMGIPTVERKVDRTELYSADEVFLCGTAAEVTPVLEIDRRTIGDGQIGPITAKLQRLFFQVVRGNNPKYLDWCRPVYAKAEATTA
ncbi:MAG: branched-chain amino acid transaminase [Chloroflexota bacterium]